MLCAKFVEELSLHTYLTVVRKYLITDILIMQNKILETLGCNPLTGKSVSWKEYSKVQWKGALDYFMAVTVLCMLFLEDCIWEVSDAYTKEFLTHCFTENVYFINKYKLFPPNFSGSAVQKLPA